MSLPFAMGFFAVIRAAAGLVTDLTVVESGKKETNILEEDDKIIGNGIHKESEKAACKTNNQPHNIVSDTSLETKMNNAELNYGRQ